MTASNLYSALLSCICGSPDLVHNGPEHSPLIAEKRKAYNAARKIIFQILSANSITPSLESQFDTASWSEKIAKHVFNTLRNILNPDNVDKRASWGEALTEAYNKAVEVATDTFRDLVQYAKDHPTETEIVLSVLLSLFVCGVLVQLAPRILILLGFGFKGPVEGSFAAWFMSTYGGYVPKGSLMSFLQRLGMTWGKA
ncbi:hypothetical protein QBC38DRAFT_502595 [Podospora fimiseda]|uniref:Uncharacterized protein n=1 Tax=Podospora fimiseda TaxID=252190 RepID=A0AAN7GZC5_9PEZI|nr:hypothetical protein QBC38DRAFT_502595 [Podospora fimiseda]